MIGARGFGRGQGASIVALTSQPETAQPEGTGTGGRHAAQPSVGQLVSEASAHFSTLLHSEIELAKLELKSSVRNAGTGIGFFGAALALLAFSMTFGLIALAEGITAAGVWRWLSYLIVFVFLLLVIGTCVWLGVRKVKRVKAPQRTIATSKDTVAYLKAKLG
jgi:hypothetical protein